MRDGWRRVRLGDVAKVVIGRQRSPKHAAGVNVVPYLRAANVQDGYLDLSDILEMNFTPAEQLTYQLQPGDVLVTEGCGSLARIGASAAWSGEFDGPVCFQNTLIRLRADETQITPGFLALWSRAAFESGVYAQTASGSSIFHLGSTRAAAITLDLPPIAEQRRIVDLSHAIEATLARSDRCVASASSASTVLIERACEQVARRRLGEIAEVKGGKRLPRGTPWSPTPTSHPYIRVIDLRDGEIVPDDLVFVSEDVWPTVARYVVERDDVLVSIAGTIGRVGVVPDELSGANLTENAALVRTNPSYDARFLAHFLASPTGQRAVRAATVGTIQMKLGLNRIAGIPVPDLLPSDQQAIAAEVSAVTAVSRSSRRTSETLTNLRAALLHDLLSGKHEIPASYDALLESASA